MFSITRFGDPDSANGLVTATVTQSTCTCEDMLVSTDGSNVTSHPPFTSPHTYPNPKTTSGALDFTIEDIPVNYETNPDSCSHVRLAGSPTFFYG